ncbi:MAG: hypothetical protein COB26_09245 [Piscirickettsiaceae bacterium]|nr:MAG: hypothetical protein COB89_02050 [Piscirickettsiaceae bacterium]PCI67772.1 MAG: hypothetical protein COB26_09245 [Piscirickettsiaceae bacterium]
MDAGQRKNLLDNAKRLVLSLEFGEQSGIDGELNKLTDKEIPDAKERLAHVIRITDEGANTALNALVDVPSLLSDEPLRIIGGTGVKNVKQVNMLEQASSTIDQVVIGSLRGDSALLDTFFSELPTCMANKLMRL